MEIIIVKDDDIEERDFG